MNSVETLQQSSFGFSFWKMFSDSRSEDYACPDHGNIVLTGVKTRADCEACCLVHQERMVVSVSFEDSCLKQLPASATPRAKWLFTDCWANQVLPHLLCCSALQGGVETTDPASGCTCYRETGTYGQEDCAGSWCCSVQHPLQKCC